MRRLGGLFLGCALVTACTAADVSSEPGAVAVTARPDASPSEPVTPAPTASPSQTASESHGPRMLVGTWRTMLGGSKLVLAITESTYRIVRGSNSATGSVSIDGDRIEFFDSSLCAGIGVYRWSITDGSLSLFPLETEPCPGRGEALLVRYPDYSPPDGG